MTQRIKIILISALMAILILSSCEPKPIVKEIKTGKPKIVVSPLFNNSDGAGILITRSFSPLLSGESDPWVMFQTLQLKRIHVKLGTATNPEALENLNPFFYTRNLQLKPYQEIHLSVYDSSRNETVMASAHVMPRPDTAGMELKLNRRENDTSLSVKIKLKDDNNSRQYYLICYSKYRKGLPVLNKQNLFGRSFYRQVEIFDNSNSVNGIINFEKTYSKEIYPFGINDSITVSISLVSEAYYRFLSVYRKSGSILAQLTAEPLNYPSNVRGGLGFFFLCNPLKRNYGLCNY